MNKFKEIVKVLYKKIQELNTDENKNMIVLFGENVRENVEIVMQLAEPILEAFGYDMAFKSRGVGDALSKEIADELEMEALRDE